jgi:hypothetical protein
MRCEHCGRPIKNAEMWKLGGDREAPTSRSMQSLCWDCRTQAEQTANAEVVRDADAKPWVMVA